mmetsp:Transcript_36913/g.75661  ORF Transcript_36913/g.75661 Transcript_36913/m.75661 type:complete len:123 (+) Transcript_36913:76-444(+)
MSDPIEKTEPPITIKEDENEDEDEDRITRSETRSNENGAEKVSNGETGDHFEDPANGHDASRRKSSLQDGERKASLDGVTLGTVIEGPLGEEGKNIAGPLGEEGKNIEGPHGEEGKKTPNPS